MAEGALFMSDQVTIEDSKDNKEKVAQCYKQLWKKRDKAVSIFNKTLVMSMVLIEGANILFIIIKRDGKLYGSEETDTDTLLTNLQFIVGNQSIFFVQFCTLLVTKALIIVLFLIAVCWYLKAHSNM